MRLRQQRVLVRPEDARHIVRGLTVDREAERLHIAQELHDGPVQELYGVHFQIAGIGPRVTPDLRDSITMVALQSLFVLPGIVLVAPLIYQIFAALGFFALVIIAPLVMLLFGLLVPHFALFGSQKHLTQ